MNTDPPDSNLEAVCHLIAAELQTLAVQRSNGGLSEEAFIAAVLEIEKKEVTPKGLTLVATNTIDDWLVFKLTYTGSSQSCAAFEFSPETGEFRRRDAC